ncbi:hypothetical protein [Gymnodinialimonas hymeniacidonis]|uniref:hypothetical protein n=1 Tax=Gymnodinialimonas hymeniacidonis TaxID=3126508 RepID=UPI0034C5CEC0
MFKFLFGGKKVAEEAVPESDREQFKRLTTDLNALIETLPIKPKITFDPATGQIDLEEPEQFADEALALPAPDAEAAEAAAKVTAAEKISEGDAVASAPTAPVGAPVGATSPQTTASDAR